MGYFSNGTEGRDYQARYCYRCVNYRDLGDGRGEGCPIWDLHQLWNYDPGTPRERLVAATKDRALDQFIPRSKDGLTNEQCKMFLEIPVHD